LELDDEAVVVDSLARPKRSSRRARMRFRSSLARGCFEGGEGSEEVAMEVGMEVGMEVEVEEEVGGGASGGSSGVVGGPARGVSDELEAGR